MKQSAVEFIRQEFLEKLTNENYKKSFDEILKQAKEIEKEQIIDARVKKPLESEWLEAEQYYNETFKNK